MEQWTDCRGKCIHAFSAVVQTALQPKFELASPIKKNGWENPPVYICPWAGGWKMRRGSVMHKYGWYEGKENIRKKIRGDKVR